MIKYTTVRIGNDVLYMDTDTPEFVQIKIDKADIILLVEGIKGYAYKGIPLTPEILEKCGFEKIRGWYSKTPIIITEKWVEIEGFNAEYTGSIIENDNCKYLHQLQNLYFSITGEELQYQP